MARRPRVKRRERRARSNVLLRRIGLGLAIALPLLYFAFTKIFFDPFEGSQPVFSVLVPRDVDLYLRRERLDSDLDGLRPRLWDRLTETHEYKELANTAWWKTQTWPADVEALLSQAATATGGPLDPVADLMGQEVAVVGRLPPTGGGDPRVAVLLRISGRAKLAVELLGYDAVRSRALPGATLEKVQDPEAPNVTWHHLDVPEGVAPGADGAWFYARRRDLLVLSRDEGLVRDVLRQIESGEETSLGLSRMYHEELPESAGAPDDRFSLEFVVDGKPLVDRLTEGEHPEATGPDALGNALKRIFDPTLLGEVAGRLELDERISLRASADVADAPAGAPAAGLRGAPAFVLRDRLHDVLNLLPSDTSGVVTLNAALRPLLETVVASLGPDQVKLINDTVRDISRYSPAWRVDSLPALIGVLERSLGDEVSIAVRPADHDVPAGSQPLPALAFLFKVKDDPQFEAIIDAVVRGYKALGIDPDLMKLVPEGVGTRKWLGVSGLPMTEFSCIVLDGETAVIGTDDDFVREIVAVYTNQRSSVASRPEVRALLDGLQPRGLANLAGWGDADELLKVLEPYATWVADTSTILDLGVVRTQQGKELLDTPKYREWKGHDGDMPEELRKAFDAELDKKVEAIQQQRLNEQVPALAAAWRERLQWLPLLKQVAFGVRLGEHDAQVELLAGTAMQR